MEKLTDNYISEHQEKYRYVQFEKVRFILIIASVLFGAVYIWHREENLLLTVACMAIPVICIVLDILFPAYFTLAFTKTEMKQNDRALRISLVAPFVLSLGFLTGATVLNFHFPAVGMLLLSGVLFGITVSLLLLAFVPEFRSELRTIALPLLILMVMGAGVTGQANYWLDMSEPETVVVEVIELDDDLRTSGLPKYEANWMKEIGAMRFSCTVRLPDGTDARFTLTSIDGILVGDRIVVEKVDGMLGLECYTIKADIPKIR